MDEYGLVERVELPKLTRDKSLGEMLSDGKLRMTWVEVVTETRVAQRIGADGSEEEYAYDIEVPITEEQIFDAEVEIPLRHCVETKMPDVEEAPAPPTDE